MTVKKPNPERQKPALADPAFLKLLRLLLALSLAAVGLYYEWGCALSSVFLFALLLWHGRRHALRWTWNLSSVAVLSVVVCYGVSVLWAVDRGLALWGFVKLLPAGLFALACMQLKPDERRVLLGDLPYLGALMTVLTYALHFLPALSGAFSIAGRLGGLFQYPNTFACFLLLGLAVLLMQKSFRKWDVLCCAVLAVGLLLARSRTVLILTVPVCAAALFVRREKKTWLLVGAALASGAAAFGLGMLLAADAANAAIRSASGTVTLLGRLLYWKDALGVTVRHPLGLGYLGYYLTQGSFQTGVYSVRWVHNDLLQLALDIGWLPAGLTAAAVARSVFSKQLDAVQRTVLLTLCAHCMADFDLSFVAMWFVLLACLDWDGRTITLQRKRSGLLIAAGGALCALSIWIGAAAAFSYAGNAAAALRIYPWDTFSAVTQLTEISDGAEMRREAEKLLRRNTSLAIAWDAKARGAFSRGDVKAMMQAKRNAIACARYSLTEYTDYFEMLAAAVELYARAGDSSSAQQCLEEIRSLQPMLDALKEETDPLAWRFPEQPELTMPPEYAEYLATTAG